FRWRLRERANGNEPGREYAARSGIVARKRAGASEGIVTRRRGTNETLFLRVPRIVGGIHIIDLPRADPMELDHSLSFGPRRVFHASGPVTKGPGRKFFRAAAIERFSNR